MALREILASFGFEVDTAGLKKGEQGATSLLDKITGFGRLAAGAFVSKEIVDFGRNLLNEADGLAKASQGLGVNAQHLQQLEHAAGLSGVGVDELRGALARLQTGAAGAADKGTTPAAVALKELGISAKKTDDTLKTSGELFEEVGIAIGEVENPTKRAGLASKFFGKSYAKLLPLFAEGQEGIDKLKGEVEELGFAFDDAFIENAESVNDNIDRLKKGLTGVVIQALGPLLPDIVELTEDLIGLTKQFIDLTRNSKVIQATLVGLGAKGVFVLAKQLGGLGGALKSLRGLVLRTILPFLVLEDALVFLSGGDSAIGEGLDAAFGEGTASKVRDWCNSVLAEVQGFFTDLVSHPQKFRDDMMLVFEGLRTGKFWEFVFGKGAMADWAQFWTDLMVAPGGVAKKFSKGLSNFFFDSEEDRAAKAVPQAVQPDTAPKGFIGGALDSFRDRYGPGRALSQAIASEKSDKEAAKITAAQKDAAFMRDMADAPTTAAVAPVASAPVVAGGSNNQVTLTNAPNVTVNVAAGTPEQVTRGVTRAAQQGATPDWAATHAALVPTGG